MRKIRKNKQEDRLNELLGLTKKVEEYKTRVTGKIVGVTENEIQEFREAQGLYYFLQAPALFSPKTCKHCNESFLVSRKFVAFCSYTCIKASLAEQGIDWTKGKDLEALVNDDQIFQGNEPLWIRNLERAQAILTSLKTNLESRELKSTESQAYTFREDTDSSTISTTPQTQPPSLPATPQTGVGKSGTNSTLKAKRSKPRIISKPSPTP